MAVDEIHVGDVGTEITLTFKDGTAIVDIAGAATKQVWIKDPRGTVNKKAGDYVTDGTDGQLKYVLVDGDIWMEGTWYIQGYIEDGAGKWHSDIHEVTVYGNID